jgi:hypothetical protein
MTPLQIIEKILGREEYESVLNTYFSEPNDEDFTEPIDKMTEVKSTMEEVDGGARTKRKTKRRGSKRKNKRRKSSKR